MGSVNSTVPRGQRIAGYALSALVILFLLMDGGMKLVPLRVVIDTTTQLGWPTDAATLRRRDSDDLGAALSCPSTSLLGAALITGYLGGAIATHALIASPLLTHTLFGAIWVC